MVGSVQIRNRATLAGNICNASPAADTAPALLVYGAEVVATGSGGTRRIPIDDFFIGPGRTALAAASSSRPSSCRCRPAAGARVHLRRTRRRGHDLASVTLACAVLDDGRARLAYGSVGPRPLLVTDDSGVLADRAASAEARDLLLDRLLAGGQPLPAVDAGQPRLPPGDAAGPRPSGRPISRRRRVTGGATA